MVIQKGVGKIATRETLLIQGVVAQLCFFCLVCLCISELAFQSLHSSVRRLLDETVIYAYRSETSCEETEPLAPQPVSGVAHRNDQRCSLTV